MRWLLYPVTVGLKEAFDHTITQVKSKHYDIRVPSDIMSASEGGGGHGKMDVVKEGA